MENNKPRNPDIERIAILVVHGVGEQKRFEHLESIAANLYLALANHDREPRIEMRPGTQVPRLSPEHSLEAVPALIHWRAPDGRRIEARFREVHWADLDMPNTPWNEIKLVGWSLSVAGVRLFDRSRVGPPQAHGMCPPRKLSKRERWRVRAELFGVSLLFLMLLGTVSLADALLKRLSIRLPLLRRLRDLVFGYLGDVKLYQDWFPRQDERLEVLGEKSRVAIRRRMVRELLATAAEVERGEIDGFYVFAHSLGTVAAFNGLMETGLSLPNYLTEEEWRDLPDSLKARQARALPESMMPTRPVWLDDGVVSDRWHEVIPRDLIDRKRLLARLRGVLTMGCPLNKFAGLWPAIVPVNGEGLDPTVPWYNVADVQDIVAGKVTLLEPCDKLQTVGGLAPTDILWGGEPILGTAHTSYWKARKKASDRLIDRLIPWLEGKPFERPRDTCNVWLLRVWYWASLPLIGLLLLWAFASLAWLLAVGVKALTGVMDPLQALKGLVSSTSASEGYWSTVWPAMVVFLVLDATIILIFALSRWAWERRKFH